MVQDRYDPKTHTDKNLKVIYKKTGEINKFGREIKIKHKWYEHVGNNKYIETTDKYKI